MRGWLRRNTAISVMFGPFLSRIDGVTELTGLSPAIRISKNGGAWTNFTGTVTHQENGWYKVDLSTTDTQTQGSLVLKSADSSTFIPVWTEFIVTSQNAYDSLVVGTDFIRVDATAIPRMEEIVSSTRYNITLYVGDDYYDADGRALTYDFTSGPSLSGATVKFKVPASSTQITGTVSGVTVKFEVPKATTSLWIPDTRYTYEVEATLSNSHVVTLVTGVLTAK